MNVKEYKNIYEQEESHFFYVALHNLIIKLIGKYSVGSKQEILDAGCGTGGLMIEMRRFGKVRGIDFSSEAIKFTRKRRLKVELGSIQKLPYRAKTFNLVTCIDVLYHRAVGDDVSALIEMKRVLKKDGVLIVRVQADKSLKTAHDRFVHSKRRYEIKGLKKKLSIAGFNIELISYIHSPLWPVAKLMLWKEKMNRNKVAKSGVVSVARFLNSILIGVLALETRLVLSGCRPMRGLGIVAVARKS